MLLLPLLAMLTAALVPGDVPPDLTAPGGAVVQQAYLKAWNSGNTDAFGIAVAASGDTLVVGAPNDDSSATGVNNFIDNFDAGQSGAASVFVREGATWVQQAWLKASNSGIGDKFGAAVAASGDTVAIAAPSEDGGSPGVNGDELDDSAPGSGAVYVFVRDGSTWTQQAYIKASNPDAQDGLNGMSVALDGDTLVVGFIGEDSAATFVNGNQADDSASSAGAAYVFVREGTTWSQQSYLKAGNAQTDDHFGTSVAVSGDMIVVGAIREDGDANVINGPPNDNSAPGAGAAYVFVRSGTTWTQSAYLKATNSDEEDRFGRTVALSGNTVVVGADGEDSDATGIDGNQDDFHAEDSGAAYVFVWNGSWWSQQAYLKASNTGVFDFFGESVSLSGDRLVVGALREESGSTGVNGDQENDEKTLSGAAYVFERDGGRWSQIAYLKASNTGSLDNFGDAVAVSGDKVVVGAPLEGSDATGVNGDQSQSLVWEYGAAYVFDLGFEPDTWEDLGQGLAGTAGVPLLAATGSLEPGAPGSLSLSQAQPSAFSTLHVSLASMPLPFKGGIFVPFPPVLNLALVTSATGTLALPFLWPAGVPAGTGVWLQITIADPGAISGVALSNALGATTP